MKKSLILAVLGIAAALVIGADDSCGTTETKSDSDQGGGSAKIGDPITLDGFEVTMKVTPVKVLDPAPTGQFDDPGKNQRIVGVEVILQNVGDVAYDDSPSNGAALIDSNARQWSPTIVTEGPCSEFFGVTIAPGSKRRGCIPFDVPAKAKITEFQFTLDSGFGPDAGIWKTR